jgi:hypothetical protein
VIRWWWQPPCLLRVVIVNLKDDPTTAIRGALWSARGPWLVLRTAALLKEGAKATPLDGDAVVHVHNVAFMQVLT